MTSPPVLRNSLVLDRDGAERFAGLATNMLPALFAIFADHPPAAAGTRLFDHAPLRSLLGPDSAITALAMGLVGSQVIPVRAILFDKSAAANWGLGWHQDRVIAVRSRVDLPGFGPWSIKRGVPHVAPPWSVLSAIRTLRVHLDPVPHDNAPLLIAPGSHRLGIVAESDIEDVAARLGSHACLAEAGDVWAYATPILHASAPSNRGRHRRVLHLDYAVPDLPAGLDYRGL